MDETMALEIRNKCERCEKALASTDEACILLRCTFCPECTEAMASVARIAAASWCGSLVPPATNI
jgi:hypothetical protein